MRVGFDIGGTFTDVIVLREDGRIETAKVLSLLDRVGEDIVACIQQSDLPGTSITSCTERPLPPTRSSKARPR